MKTLIVGDVSCRLFRSRLAIRVLGQLTGAREDAKMEKFVHVILLFSLLLV